MNAILFLIIAVLDIVWWFIIISIVLSWLVSFNVINLQNQFVSSIYFSLNSVVEPMLKPFRRILPDMGGIDISPLLLLVLIGFLRVFVTNDLPRYLGAL